MAVSHEQRLAQIMALKASGLTAKEIASRLGIAESTVRNRLYDPDGLKQKARRARYQGVCVDCGGPTDGSNGLAKASLKCKWCAAGKVAPYSLRPRLRIPVRLSDLPLEVRLEGAHEANRIEKGNLERTEILTAAIFPSDKIYWVSESALPLLAEMNVKPLQLFADAA